MNVLAIAHRAGNSLAALRAGRDVGAHVLEADVRASRGRLEVRHAKSLGPLPWLWDRHGTSSLPSPRDRWELTRATDQLQLAELLDAAADGATLMLDLKGVGQVGPAVVRLLHERTPSAPIIVCGRWWPSVDAFAGRDWARLTLSARGGASLASLRRRLRQGPAPYAVSLHQSLVDRDVVEELRGRVEVVMTWPVNDLETLGDVLDAGANGIISDDPNVLRTVIGRGAS